jgi:hypothetical protein
MMSKRSGSLWNHSCAGRSIGEVSAGELWPHFFALLAHHGLNPKEIPHPVRGKQRYEYLVGDKKKKISYGQFANTLSKARNQKSG